MLKTIIRSTLTFLLISCTWVTNASMITTTFNSNNGHTGNMFDLTTFSNDLLITGLDVNLENTIGSDVLIDVYIKTGSYTGFENNASAWTLVSSSFGISSGTNNPTFIDISDFYLEAAKSFGVYITTDDSTMKYTNGANLFENDDLQVVTGIGIGGLFGSAFNPRTWNGSIHYDVPEPSTIAIFLLGLCGLVISRNRKVQ
ncbi:PEP-CTERM sorting domain-containing protein [Aliivibrio kagoshimensis]|uniref:PEP-CTERM sorting domain-containing protein n=1 Tax=Aliivibrio kagoshimensis TaxID=2910230 RepID=UPI003D0EA17D